MFGQVSNFREAGFGSDGSGVPRHPQMLLMNTFEFRW